MYVSPMFGSKLQTYTVLKPPLQLQLLQLTGMWLHNYIMLVSSHSLASQSFHNSLPQLLYLVMLIQGQSWWVYISYVCTYKNALLLTVSCSTLLVPGSPAHLCLPPTLLPCPSQPLALRYNHDDDLLYS